MSAAARVVTANALRQGDVVYLTASGGWSPALSEARLILDPGEAQHCLDQARAQSGAVVGAYLADVATGPGGPKPLHFRERFRARGPSNYPHGKQETDV